MVIYDVCVVGAGIAGSYIAWHLGKMGYKVLLFDKSKNVKIDSGIVSTEILNYLDVESRLIKKKIKKMKFVSPSGLTFSIKNKKPFCFILKREMFGTWLRKRAERYARFIIEEFEKLKIGKEFIQIKTKSDTYSSKILVGADGALSKVREQLGIGRPRIVFGVMCYDREYNKTPIIWMDKRFSRDFFAWFSPPHEYGLISQNNLIKRLEFFSKSVGFEIKKPYIRPIPIGFTKSYFKRVALVGDACGQTKPFTGGGIIFSLICSNILINTISRGLNFNKFSDRLLYDYERNWKSVLGNEIKIQLLIRKIYSILGNKHIDAFFKEFGKTIENINNFEYDRILTIIKQINKVKIFKYVARLL